MTADVDSDRSTWWRGGVCFASNEIKINDVFCPRHLYAWRKLYEGYTTGFTRIFDVSFLGLHSVFIPNRFTHIQNPCAEISSSFLENVQIKLFVFPFDSVLDKRTEFALNLYANNPHHPKKRTAARRARHYHGFFVSSIPCVLIRLLYICFRLLLSVLYLNHHS